MTRAGYFAQFFNGEKLNELIWGSVIFTHLALAALIASKSIQNQLPSATFKSIGVKTVTLQPLAPQKPDQKGDAVQIKAAQRTPLPQPLVKAKAPSDAIAPSVPATAKKSIPVQPAQQVVAIQTNAISQSAANHVKSGLAPKSKLKAHSCQIGKKPALSAPTARSSLDQKRAKAQKSALALISNVGNHLSSASLVKSSSSPSPRSGAPFPQSDESEDRYNAKLIAVLTRHLQLQEKSMAKVELVIDDNGTYLSHTIISCSSTLCRDDIDQKLPELSFLPFDVKSGQPHAIILNLKGE